MPLFFLVYIAANPGLPVHQTVPADDIPIDALHLYVRISIMGFATHLGPWLLGTVKNTTGTTAGTIRNTGTAIVCQSAAVTSADAATSSAFTIPAGSMLTAVQILQSTTFTGTSGVITIYLNGTAVATCAAITGGTAGVITFTGTAAQMATWANIGSTDGIITYTMASSGSLSAGAGTLVMAYAVRDSSGNQYPPANQQ